jgi:hypothetical protein
MCGQIIASRWTNLLYTIDVQLRKLAEALQHRYMRTNTAWKRVHFIVFCLAFGVGSGMCIIQAFDQPTAIFRIDHISKPRSIFPLDSQQQMMITSPSKGDFVERVLRFDLYLDSLKTSDRGARVYDSIVSARPGLMDSVKLVKRIFQR